MNCSGACLPGCRDRRPAAGRQLQHQLQHPLPKFLYQNFFTKHIWVSSETLPPLFGQWSLYKSYIQRRLWRFENLSVKHLICHLGGEPWGWPHPCGLKHSSVSLMSARIKNKINKLGLVPGSLGINAENLTDSTVDRQCHCCPACSTLLHFEATFLALSTILYSIQYTTIAEMIGRVGLLLIKRN